MDPETMKEVPKDGKTIGEIMIRGNVVMKGYFKDRDATNKAMKGGWFRVERGYRYCFGGEYGDFNGAHDHDT